MEEQKKVIEGIQKEIEASKGTHIWSDYVNALKLISQVVFTRSSGFILEFIQNAEDSGMCLSEPGVFEIKINNDRVKIIHNGRPFSEIDVNAVCGIRSSKKPERGTLGYLGIGFKSVFKVSDAPEVYSNGYQFKFDRNSYKDPSNTPWHVIPVWIDQPSEAIEETKTVFIIPFREKAIYSNLQNELKQLEAGLYLFLRWLKKIIVIDEPSSQIWTLENQGEIEGITILKHNDKEHRFKFFHRTVSIPDWVKEDRLTQEYRANVAQREIAIAFALDSAGNLAPLPAGAMYGGVYSFSPLGEEKSGAKFPIQADFLVQPGRDAVNYEAKWNHWMLDEVADLCKEAVGYFKNHDTWKYQFLPALEFSKSRGHEAYDKLFGPKLIEPIERFLKGNDCVPTIEGGWAKPEEVVMLMEAQEATEDLINMGLFRREDIAPVFGGKPRLKLADTKLTTSTAMQIKEVDRLDFLNNAAFLDETSNRPDAAIWFKNLYLWLHSNPRWERRSQEGYWNYKIVLTADGKLSEGRHIWLPDFNPSDPLLKDLDNRLQKSKPVLHPDILASVRDEDELKALRGFLTGRTGVQILDSKTVCKEALLPKILTTAPKPPPDDLLKYTTYCRQILGVEINRGMEFWVLTKDGVVKAAREVLFSKEFKPLREWETHQEFVSGLCFLSQHYLTGVTSDEDLKVWREFFGIAGVKEAPDNGVEEFAMSYAEKQLKTIYRIVEPVEKRNYGYDLKAETYSGETTHIEVKGQSSDSEVMLTGNQTDAADMHKDAFYLCVVASIPDRPIMHMVKNPAAPGVGKKDKLTIPVSIWKGARWP